MYYLNTSTITKRFYGVEFKPGEVKDTPGFINDPYMVRTDKPKIVPLPKVTKPVKVESKPETKDAPKAESDVNSENASK